ncbi:MAG: sigma-70 family RNA polymerase sigma factor [Deltaproteobacteria bacterium]|nr:sigma-70 family RNA polymerase sigma factor [Deltaproteobacteria bacterium]
MNRQYENTAIEHLLEHAGWLRGLAMHLAGGRDVGDDAVQETWTATIRRPPDPSLPAQPWLARVVHNFVRRRYRAEDRRWRHEAAAGALQDTATESPDVLAMRAEAYQAIARLVTKLEPRHKNVILLRFYEHKNATEIGQCLGIPAGTVRRQLKEALDRLRNDLRTEEEREGNRWLGALVPSTFLVGTVVRPAILASKAMTKVGIAAIGAALLAGLLIFARNTRGPQPDPQPPVAASDDHDGPSLRPAFMFPSSAEHGSVEGKVTDTKGMPIAGAWVTVTSRLQGMLKRSLTPSSGTFSVSKLTDAQGRFRLEKVRPGLLAMAASAKGYQTKGVPISLDPAQDLKDVVVELLAGGVTLSGNVVDTGGGAIPSATASIFLPLENASRADAENTFATAETQADSAGHFELWLSRGSAELQIGANGYATSREWLTLVDDTHRIFRLNPAARISGKVIEAGSGTPVVAAQVVVSPLYSFGLGLPSNAVITDARGRFSTDGLDPGKYQLDAKSASLVGRTPLPVRLALGDVADVVVEMSPGLSVAGRITDTKGGALAGATVAIGPAPVITGTNELTTFTDKDGRYRLDGVSPGQPNLNATLDGFAAASMSLSLIDKPLTAVDLQLQNEALLRVLVTDTNDRPVQGAQGTLIISIGAYMIGREGDSPSDRNGVIDFHKLNAGPAGCSVASECGWTLSVGEPCRASASTRVVLSANKITEVKLRLGGAATLKGMVRWDDESPAAQAIVEVRKDDGFMPASAITSANGRFEIPNLSAGRYSVNARAADSGFMLRKADPRSFKEITLGDGVVPSELSLTVTRQNKSISGVAQDVSGRPVAAAQIGVIDEQESRGGWGSCDGAFAGKHLTDTEGRFTVDKLPTGNFALCGRHPDHPDVQKLGVASGTEGNVLRFKASGGISGRVVSAKGLPVKQYLILASPVRSYDRHGFAAPIKGTPTASQLVTDRQGHFAMAGIEEGTFNLLAIAPDETRGTAIGIEVKANQTKGNVEIHLREPQKITGRVVSAVDGAGVPATIIDATDFMAAALRPPKPVSTDQDGKFTIATGMPGTTCLLLIEPLSRHHIGDSRELWLPQSGDQIDVGNVKLFPAQKSKDDNGGAMAETGLRVAHEGGHAVVTGIYENSPASKSGILRRDRILAIDGRPVEDLGGRAIGTLLSGEPGTTINVRVQTGSNAPRDVQVTRGEF